MSPLGLSEEEKNPWEVRQREMYQQQRAWLLAAGPAALFLPSNSHSQHEMHLMGRGSLSWPGSLLFADTMVPHGSSAGGQASFW